MLEGLAEGWLGFRGLFGVFHQDWLIFKKGPSFRLCITQQVVIYELGLLAFHRPNSGHPGGTHLSPAITSGVQLVCAAHSLSGDGEEEQSILLTSAIPVSRWPS